MDFYDPQTIRKADSRAISEIGIPGMVLMENAGRNAVEILMKEYKLLSSVCILVGPGNNGGDGLVMARHFMLKKVDVVVISAIKTTSFRGDSAINLKIAKSLGIQIYSSPEILDEDIHGMICSSDLCVDALLGTGSKGCPRGECSRIISLIPPRIPVVSVDIPSGIDPLNGQVYSPCINSVLTITMLAPKTGLGLMPAARYSGNLKVADIGVPKDRVLIAPPRIIDFTENNARRNLPERPLDMHKGQRGNVTAIGGAPEYRGSLALTALGCLRTGAGLVFTLSSIDAQNTVSSFLPEVITWGFPFDEPETLTDNLMHRVKLLEERSDSMVIGPGLGRNLSTLRLVTRVWNEVNIPIVLDADALFLLSEIEGEMLRRENVVLTPHEGEASRLLGTDIGTVRKDRLGCVRELSTRWGVVLLKGYHTLIDDGVRTAVILGGNQSLAIPGSGDVLSGIISSLLAGGVQPFEAACTGAWLHARAGDELSVIAGLDGVIARELAERIPGIVNRLRLLSANEI